MQSNITLHIVEPGSTPVDPVVPNTGLFTNGIGSTEDHQTGHRPDELSPNILLFIWFEIFLDH